jgi:hypothetical protein
LHQVHARLARRVAAQRGRQQGPGVGAQVEHGAVGELDAHQARGGAARHDVAGGHAHAFGQRVLRGGAQQDGVAIDDGGDAERCRTGLRAGAAGHQCQQDGQQRGAEEWGHGSSGM